MTLITHVITENWVQENGSAISIWYSADVPIFRTVFVTVTAAIGLTKNFMRTKYENWESKTSRSDVVARKCFECEHAQQMHRSHLPQKFYFPKKTVQMWKCHFKTCVRVSKGDKDIGRMKARVCMTSPSTCDCLINSSFSTHTHTNTAHSIIQYNRSMRYDAYVFKYHRSFKKLTSLSPIIVHIFSFHFIVYVFPFSLSFQMKMCSQRFTRCDWCILVAWDSRVVVWFDDDVRCRCARASTDLS